MTLNPILNGIKRGFEITIDPQKELSLQKDIYNDHGQTVYYDNHNELIESVALSTSAYLKKEEISAYAFLMSVLKLDKNDEGYQYIFSVWNEHLVQMDQHVSLLAEINKNQSAGKNISWEHARSRHKLHANAGLIEDIKSMPRPVTEQLTDAALVVDEMLWEPKLENSPVMSILGIAVATYDEDKKNAPHRITELMHSHKIKHKNQPDVRKAVETVQNALTGNQTTKGILRNLFIASLEQDENNPLYAQLTKDAKDKTLLMMKHNFDSTAFTNSYDKACEYDNRIFLQKTFKSVQLS